jgi:glycosyltransferase involved in cell wall biosynthesis
VKIAYIVPRCVPDNSHGRYVIELASRLTREHDVTIYSGAFVQGLPVTITRRVLPVVDWPMIGRMATTWAAALMTPSAGRQDVVHIQGADAPTGTVVTAHCCTAAMSAAAPPTTMHRRISHAVGARAERFSFGKSSTRAVIAVSQKVRDEVEQHYHVPTSKMTVVSPGVDLDTFNPTSLARKRVKIRQDLGIADGEFAVLYVGGDQKLKGLDPLLQALRQIGAPATGLIVGVSPLRRPSGVVERIHWIGRTSDIVPYFAAADCFVLPTLYDTFSLATLEAMAGGIPSIVSRAAGIAELITDRQHALLLDDPASVEELASKIRQLIDDRELRACLAAGGREFAEQHSWDRVAAQTLDVYRAASKGAA